MAAVLLFLLGLLRAGPIRRPKLVKSSMPSAKPSCVTLNLIPLIVLFFFFTHRQKYNRLGLKRIIKKGGIENEYNEYNFARPNLTRNPKFGSGNTAKSS
jgi:hypothetical protein